MSDRADRRHPRPAEPPGLRPRGGAAPDGAVFPQRHRTLPGRAASPLPGPCPGSPQGPALAPPELRCRQISGLSGVPRARHRLLWHSQLLPLPRSQG